MGELQKLAEWVCNNMLSLNVKKKPEYMIFKLKITFQSENHIILNGIPIERVQMFKFLDVLIDENLTWDQHVVFLKNNKIVKGLGVLYKSKRLLKATTLLKFYYSLIYPYLIYGIEVWGIITVKRLLPLFALQKRAFRQFFVSANKNIVCSTIFDIECSSNIWDLYV